MFKIEGILKKDEIREFTKKDGSINKKRVIYIEPRDSIFPVEINISDQALDLGRPGDQIILDVCMYPYYFENGQRKKANINYYVPSK